MPAPPCPDVALGELPGVWRRSLLVRSDGTRDTTTRVTWVQAASLYVDLRLPVQDLPVRPLSELDLPDLLLLADRQAFAGVLRAEGDVVVWDRLVDLHPPTGGQDAGRLTREGDVVVERGRDEDYVEHWHRDDSGPAAGVLLRDDTGRSAVLVRAGSTLAWARGRDAPLPLGARLHVLLRAAPDVAAARRLLDVEVVVGPSLTVPSRGWEVLAVEGDPSLLPLPRGLSL